MKKKLLTIVLSIFMIFGTIVNVVHADGLGDTPTIHDVLHTRQDFTFVSTEVETTGWRNSNNYKLYCVSEEYAEGGHLKLIDNDGYYSYEINVSPTEKTTKVGNNYKITTTDGVKGGNLDLLFVMNDDGVLDYIEVTAPNSLDVAGIYAKSILNLGNIWCLPMEDNAWTNDNGYSVFYDYDDLKLKIQKDLLTIEIPSNAYLTYSNNTYKYSNEGKTVLFNLESEPSGYSVQLNSITVSGYDASTIDGTYSLIHAGQEYWIDVEGYITSDDMERMFKVRANSDVSTFTLTGAESQKIAGELYLPFYVCAQSKEYAITNISDNAFKGYSNLKDVFIYGDTFVSLGTGVFDNCSDDLVIHVPANSVNTYKENSTWLPYKDRIQSIYTVDDIINTNTNFPRLIGTDIDGFLWSNENGAIVYYLSGEYSCLVFDDNNDAYFDILYGNTFLDKKENGNFESKALKDFLGADVEFVMEDDALISITLSNIEYYNISFSNLNGTYIPSITIADILNTAADDFPATQESGWVDESGFRAYTDNNNLVIMNDTIPLSTVLTKDGNNYKYEYDTDLFYIFNIESGVFVSITETNFNNTFLPYQFTSIPTSIAAGQAEEIEFVTNGKYIDQSTTPVTVKIDGNPLDSANYTVTDGSTHVKLKGSYVSTLPAGTHTITISVTGTGDKEYSDISSQFTITAVTTPSSKRTSRYKAPITGVDGTYFNNR